jgi:hypothetical protein
MSSTKRHQPWTDVELAALREIEPNSHGAVDRFRKRFCPSRSKLAVNYKLAVLRQRGEAKDYLSRQHELFREASRRGSQLVSGVR